MEIIICDDEEYTAKYIEKCLKVYLFEHHDSVFSDFEKYIATNPYDGLSYTKDADVLRLCILDVYLKTDIDGIDLAEALIEQHPTNTYIIFATSTDSLPRAINHHTRPLAYINKGIDFETELEKTLRKSEKIFRRTNATVMIGKYKLKIDDIIYIESIKGTNYINIFCDSRKYKVRLTISKVLEIMDKRFYRLDKSLIINVNKAEMVENIVFFGKRYYKCVIKEAEALKELLNMPF